MARRLSVVVLLTALAMLAGACDSTALPSTNPTAETLALLTQPPPGANAGCDAALIEGRLALDPRSGLGIAGGEGLSTPVAWPNGYTARLLDGVLVLYDHQGNAVARLGDQVALGGGQGAGGVWHTCHGQVRAVQR